MSSHQGDQWQLRGIGLPGDEGLSGPSPEPPDSLGDQPPGSWRGLIFSKRPGSGPAVGHGRCDWAAGLVAEVRGGQKAWAYGLEL